VYVVMSDAHGNMPPPVALCVRAVCLVMPQKDCPSRSMGGASAHGDPLTRDAGRCCAEVE
jgi:hypothetical protein